VQVIGIIGGMSWESSAEYYRLINQEVNRKLGGLHSAEILMFSVDFEEIEELQHSARWEEATKIMVDAARRLERGGADFLVIATNTMHRMADDVQNSVRIPLLHIADATGDRIKEEGFKKVGLLGTIYTMEQDFYKGRLIHRYGLEVSVPANEDRKLVNDIIYTELCLGKINQSSKQNFVRIINGLAANGAQAVILGCTEISLLVQQNDVKVPLFDTTLIHAQTAVAQALATHGANRIAQG
jgi:aspartate racemase